MRRADRLFQIIQYLRNRRLTTAKWLAEKLEVSERTIYRDIQDLMLSGVPIEGEAGVGYVLRHGFDIPPIMFTKDEIEALVIAARLVKTWAGSKLARSADSALDKIEAVLPNNLKKELAKPRLYTPEVLTNSSTAALLDDLREAVNAKQVIHVEYLSLKGETTQRELKPLGLFFWGKVWTLAAWCELRHSYRSFRVDLITRVSSTDRVFEEDDKISFSAFLNEAYGEMGRGGLDH
ncbi:HTH domain-containing protein [Oceanospirillum multiglobuliferum]|uniref:DNA-binding transcriptional regulator n=1 Tax=Oceanospirillum multiglobuliferum TaxID=64969 RepID=A0A1T4QAF2_9GAMM|nr:YafY family protein [Oceanospirillum multiglobuliferum]OPX56548.1 DNA-binding transcriptional regulator [Oceanospirillum multiglobuliferum]SKA00753.1 HTH domain-containing protein [Oceanospirillum multiglobuliferum]